MQNTSIILFIVDVIIAVNPPLFAEYLNDALYCLYNNCGKPSSACRWNNKKLTSVKDVLLKGGLSPFKKKKKIYLLQWKPFKNDKKRFLFHLKSYFCSQNFVLKMFFLTFWSCRRKGLIRKIKSISKFLTSQLI